MIDLVIDVTNYQAWYTDSKGITVTLNNRDEHFYPWSIVKSFKVILKHED